MPDSTANILNVHFKDTVQSNGVCMVSCPSQNFHMTSLYIDFYSCCYRTWNIVMLPSNQIKCLSKVKESNQCYQLCYCFPPPTETVRAGITALMLSTVLCQLSTKVIFFLSLYNDNKLQHHHAAGSFQ